MKTCKSEDFVVVAHLQGFVQRSTSPEGWIRVEVGGHHITKYVVDVRRPGNAAVIHADFCPVQLQLHDESQHIICCR